MKMRELGRTGIKVSQLCLGSMTWGTQNTVDEGCAQIDQSIEAGINFIDTAEMYPTTPMRHETTGDTERVIGAWVERTGKRDQMVLATKVTGKGYKGVRDGAAITRASMTEAVEGSLQRLKTDYIDLYQLHWPNRGSYMFRQNWTYDPTGQNKSETLEHMSEILETADALIKAGKIRSIGLSNESAWGAANWLRLSEERGLPRMATTQNEYSLLCRLFDTDLAELSHNEDFGLLSFSPLAAGLLTGKYQNGAIPDGSRWAINGSGHGRDYQNVFPAVDAYQAVADKHSVDLVQMSIAWCMSRPFMTSAIFGATTPQQLTQILGAAEITLSKECLKDIDLTNRAYPMPY